MPEGKRREVLPEVILLPVGEARLPCLGLPIEAYFMITAGA